MCCQWPPSQSLETHILTVIYTTVLYESDNMRRLIATLSWIRAAEQSPLLSFGSYNGRQAVFGLAVTTAGNHNKVYMELASAAAIRCPNGFFSGAGTEPDVLRTSCSPLPLPGWGQRHHSVRGRWKRPRLWFCHVKVGFTPLVPHSSFCLCSLCHVRQCFRVRRRRRRKRRRELPEHGGGLTRI